MAKAKKPTIEPTPTTEAVPTEQATELAVPAGIAIVPDELGVAVLSHAEVSYALNSVIPESADTAEDTTEPSAPEMPEAPDVPEVAEESASIVNEDDVTSHDTTPPHPYEDKAETTNKCPYCNMPLARIPPDMFNPETNGTYYRQSCPSCPYVERVDTETSRVFHVEWPIHK